MANETNTFAPRKWTAEDFARASESTTSAPMTASRPVETRSFAADPVVAPAATYETRSEPMTERELRTDAHDGATATAFAGAPVGTRTTTTRKRAHGGVSPLALAAIPAVVLAAGVAYFVMQPRDTQVAAADTAPAAAAPVLGDTTAGATTTTAAADGGAARVSTTTPAARTEMASRTAPTQVAANRVRPAAAASASAADVGVDASATLPAGPVAYSSLNPDAPAAATSPSPVAPPTIAVPAAPAAAAAPEAVAPAPEAEAPAAVPEASTPGDAVETPTP